MKTKLFILLIFCIMLIIGCNSGVSKSITYTKYKVGTKFVLAQLGLSGSNYVLDYKSGDVNGDKVKDDIILVGQQEGTFGPFSDNICILICDGQTKQYKKIIPWYNSGLNAYLSTGQFNYDNITDIFYGVNTGGNGDGGISCYDIFSVKGNNTVSLLSNDEFVDRLDYEVVFLPDYKIKIRNLNINKTFIVDVEDDKKLYESEGIYKNGKLSREIEGGADDYCSIQPIDIDHDGILELEAHQYIYGFSRPDGIGEAKSILKLDNKSSKWIVKKVTFKKY